MLGAVALVALLGAVGFVALRRGSSLQPRQLLAPPTLPSAEPVIVEPQVEVTETTLSLNGAKLLDLPPLDEQARDGVGTRHMTPAEYPMEITALREALLRLGTLPPAARERLRLTFARQTPFRLLLTVLFTAHGGGFTRYRLITPASSAGPAIALDSEAPAPRETNRPADSQWLLVHVHGSDVDLEAHDTDRRELVGSGCVAGGSGPSARLQEEADYAILAQCLRGRSGLAAPSTGVTASITADDATPTARLLEVASVLRCGERSCPTYLDRTSLYEGPLFSVRRKKPSGQPPADADEGVEKLRPLLTHCFEEHVASHPNAGPFHVRLQVEVQPDGKNSLAFDPPLPATFGRCIESEVERAALRFPPERTGTTKYVIPFDFVRK